jgi:hypothetical protein
MAVSQITSNPGAGGRFLFCRKARGTDTGGTLILQPFLTFAAGEFLPHPSEFLPHSSGVFPTPSAFLPAL